MDRQVLKQRGTKTTIEVKQHEFYRYKNNCISKTTVNLQVQKQHGTKTTTDSKQQICKIQYFSGHIYWLKSYPTIAITNGI